MCARKDRCGPEPQKEHVSSPPFLYMRRIIIISRVILDFIMRAGGISELKIYEGSEPGKWCTKTSVTFVRARCHNLRSPGGPRQWGFKQILWGNLRPTNFQFIFVLRRPAKANARPSHLHVCVSFFGRFPSENVTLARRLLFFFVSWMLSIERRHI